VTAMCLAHKIFPQTKLNSMDTRYIVYNHLLEHNKDETNKNKIPHVIHNNVIYMLDMKSWITNHKFFVKNIYDIDTYKMNMKANCEVWHFIQYKAFSLIYQSSWNVVIMICYVLSCSLHLSIICVEMIFLYH
jgi:CMP-N-acetylneuraminic acid synthetase